MYSSFLNFGPPPLSSSSFFFPEKNTTLVQCLARSLQHCLQFSLSQYASQRLIFLNMGKTAHCSCNQLCSLLMLYWSSKVPSSSCSLFVMTSLWEVKMDSTLISRLASFVARWELERVRVWCGGIVSDLQWNRERREERERERARLQELTVNLFYKSYWLSARRMSLWGTGNQLSLQWTT